MKKIIALILSVVLLIIIGISIIANIFANRILYPSWYVPGLTETCFTVQKYSAPHLCRRNPQQGLKETFEPISIPYKTGAIKGWFFPVQQKEQERVVVFIHGAGSDRRSGYFHVPYLQKAGFSVVLYDAPNHGISYNNGVGVTFGKYEQDGFSLILDWLQKNHPQSKIYVIATSAGTSAFLFAAKHWQGKVQAAVLENPIYSLDRIVHDNPLTRSVPEYLVDIVYWFIEQKAGFSPKTLLPYKEAEKIADIPILVLHGTPDQTIPIQHGKDLYAHLASTQKKFIEVAKGKHSMLIEAIPEQFRKEVLQLFTTANPSF